MRLALGEDDRRQRRLLFGFDDLEAGSNGRRGEEAADALGNDAGDGRHWQFAGRRQQPLTMRPLALLVEFADDARADILAPVVELLLELVFEQLAFFLDDENFLQPFGKVADAFRFERPDHADLVQADADLGGQRIVDAEFVERLADVEIGFCRRSGCRGADWASR